MLGSICPNGDRDAFNVDSLRTGVYQFVVTSNDYDKKNPPYLYVDLTVYDTLMQRNVLSYPSCSFSTFQTNSQK